MPLAHCDVAITPAGIRAMYNFTQGTSAVPHNELGIFENIGDIYSQEDLDEFFRTLQPRIPQGTHPILNSVDGGTAPTTVADAGPESNLDFQISYPIIWPQNSVLFQTDDPVYEANYTFLGFFNNLLDAIDGSYCSYTSDGITGNFMPTSTATSTQMIIPGAMYFRAAKCLQIGLAISETFSSNPIIVFMALMA